MSTRTDLLDLNRALRIEARRPVPHPTHEDQRLADLRAVIHLLAMAMTEGRAVA
jgi:hypothetical protein